MIYLIDTKETREELLKLGWSYNNPHLFEISNLFFMLAFSAKDIEEQIITKESYPIVTFEKDEIITIKEFIKRFCTPTLKYQLDEVEDILHNQLIWEKDYWIMREDTRLKLIKILYFLKKEDKNV